MPAPASVAASSCSAAVASMRDYRAISHRYMARCAPSRHIKNKMPKRIPEAELEAIVRTVGLMSEGGSVNRIRDALRAPSSKRTLQRRLTALVRQGRLVRDGHGPGTRYRIPPTQPVPPVAVVKLEDQLHLDDELDPIPLSTKGASWPDWCAHHSAAPACRLQPGVPRRLHPRFDLGTCPRELRQRLWEQGRSPDQDGVREPMCAKSISAC